MDTAWTRQAKVAAVACALGVSLAACGGDEPGTGVPTDSQAGAGATTTAPASPTTSAEASETTAAGAPAGEVTEPDTELAVGDTATVPFTYAKKDGTIAITVTKVEKGAEADLAAFGDKAKGLTPYYIHATIENVDGGDFAYASVRLRAVDASGRGTGVIISGGVPGKCESENGPKDFTSAGATYETCVLQASSGVDIAGVSFAEGEKYRDSPVIWKM